jgi:hypothetical protein
MPALFCGKGQCGLRRCGLLAVRRVDEAFLTSLPLLKAARASQALHIEMIEAKVPDHGKTPLLITGLADTWHCGARSSRPAGAGCGSPAMVGGQPPESHG